MLCRGHVVSYRRKGHRAQARVAGSNLHNGVKDGVAAGAAEAAVYDVVGPGDSFCPSEAKVIST